MQWQDDAIILTVAKHGETSVIADLLTLSQGRHRGLIRGGTGTRQRGVLQPGNKVRAEWKARLAEHLGAFQIELDTSYAAALMTAPAKLAAMSSLCAVAGATLPEREPHAEIYAATVAVLDLLADDECTSIDATAAIIRWELALLSVLGFGLDLSACAVTGATEGLIYVSPRSGRAVSAEGAGDYADRLLPLPAFLTGTAAADPTQITDGLVLTGNFIEHHILHPIDRTLPPARTRFADMAQELDAT